MSSPCSFFLQINAAVVFAHPRMYTMTFNVAVYRIVSYRIVSYIIVLHRIVSGHIIVAWHVRGERRWILSFCRSMPREFSCGIYPAVLCRILDIPVVP